MRLTDNYHDSHVRMIVFSLHLNLNSFSQKPIIAEFYQRRETG